MAKLSLIVKSKRQPKFSTRKHFRCEICGRSRGYLRRFRMCRICFREQASAGNLPGVQKASW